MTCYPARMLHCRMSLSAHGVDAVILGARDVHVSILFRRMSRDAHCVDVRQQD